VNAGKKGKFTEV